MVAWHSEQTVPCVVMYIIYANCQFAVYCSLQTSQFAFLINPSFSFYFHVEVPQFATDSSVYLAEATGNEFSSFSERSLAPIIPTTLPYSLRLSSVSLADDGALLPLAINSGSMALFDAGIPGVDRPVAAVNVGVVGGVKEGEETVFLHDLSVRDRS